MDPHPELLLNKEFNVLLTKEFHRLFNYTKVKMQSTFHFSLGIHDDTGIICRYNKLKFRLEVNTFKGKKALNE